MTGPIKPPGGPTGPSTPTPADAPVGKGEPGAFRETLATEAAPNAEASAGVSASVTADLRAGQITPAEAIDRLVAEALKSPMAGALNDAGRQALEVHLRESLAEDPNISSLVSDLERGQ